MTPVFKITFLLSLMSLVAGEHLICYYDSTSYLRPGLAKILNTDLELALQFCTHLIYGYAGLNPVSREIFSLNVDLDMWHYREITSLKTKFPNLKVYLSIGGDRDIDLIHPNKYVEFLESGVEEQKDFIVTAIELLKVNGFDGLDLAFQFPKNKPRKVHTPIGMYWKQFKKIFTGDFVVDEAAEAHKTQFTQFVENLHHAFKQNKLDLALTVLPNVNSTWYFDIPKLTEHFTYINLEAFDFLTPERNPDEADYTAPIYAPPEQNRLAHYNIDFQVQYWLSNGCPAKKLVLGLASFGRAWKLSKASGLSGVPVVPDTQGASNAGVLSNSLGLLSWPEICAKMPSKANEHYRGEKAPLRKVSDIEQKYGNYALRPADENGEHGLWVSFDDPDFAGIKAAYAKSRGLAGVALIDLSYDDARGLCAGPKFPILRSIKYFL